VADSGARAAVAAEEARRAEPARVGVIREHRRPALDPLDHAPLDAALERRAAQLRPSSPRAAMSRRAHVRARRASRSRAPSRGR
jgi:hypothetical protein